MKWHKCTRVSANQRASATTKLHRTNEIMLRAAQFSHRASVAMVFAFGTVSECARPIQLNSVRLIVLRSHTSADRFSSAAHCDCERRNFPSSTYSRRKHVTQITECVSVCALAVHCVCAQSLDANETNCGRQLNAS